jgi:hypothetical protein
MQITGEGVGMQLSSLSSLFPFLCPSLLLFPSLSLCPSPSCSTVVVIHLFPSPSTLCPTLPLPISTLRAVAHSGGWWPSHCPPLVVVVVVPLTPIPLSCLHHSTRDPPHKQLLVRLEVGGGSFVMGCPLWCGGSHCCSCSLFPPCKQLLKAMVGGAVVVVVVVVVIVIVVSSPRPCKECGR